MSRALDQARRAIAVFAGEVGQARDEASCLQRPTHYTVDEAVVAMGVGRSTVMCRIADGSLASRKVGGRRLILSMDLELAGLV